MDTKLNIVVKATSNDIVPQDMQNQLMYWRDIFRAGQFFIGDCAAQLIEENATAGHRYTQEQICKAIGYWCGRSARTVRYYYETAVFFPQEAREEYDTLPFSHFVFARQLGDQWEEVLEFSRLNPGASEEFLAWNFLEKGRGEVSGGSEGLPTEIAEQDSEGIPGETGLNKDPALQKNLMRETSQNNRLERHALFRIINDVSRSIRGLITHLDESELDETERTEVREACAVIFKHLGIRIEV